MIKIVPAEGKGFSKTNVRSKKEAKEDSLSNVSPGRSPARKRYIASPRSFTEPKRAVETRLGPTVRREAARNIFFASQMAFIRGRDYRYV
jgi:hypothetical protein